MPEGTIKRITIDGFKSIRHADVELRPINVLIGANGSGKSNFIGVFELLQVVVAQKNILPSYSAIRGAGSFLYFGRKTTHRLRLSVTLDVGNEDSSDRLAQYSVALIPTNQDALLIEEEQFPGGIGELEMTGYARTWTDQTVAVRDNGEIVTYDWVIKCLESWRIYHFHDTSRTAAIKYPGDLHDNRFLRADGSNLAAFLYLLKERYTDYYTRIVKTIRLIAPFFDDFVLKPLELEPEQRIRLEWREINSDETFTAHQMSDGTLRFICLATLLQQPNPPPVILIDEPELGLHPAAITILAGMMQSMIPKTQIIMTTQSPAFVSEFEPEDILVLYRKTDPISGKYETIIGERLDTDALANWLEEYSLGELWEKNVIGGRPSP